MLDEFKEVRMTTDSAAHKNGKNGKKKPETKQPQAPPVIFLHPNDADCDEITQICFS